MGDGPLKICLVTPLPPPNGGMGKWAKLICDHAGRQCDVALRVVDVSPRWRAIDDMVVWKRVVIGGLTMLWHAMKVTWHLARGCRAMHVCTPGQLAVFRDILLMRIARLFGVRPIYHLHFGRIPELAEANNAEWKRISRALSVAHTVLAIDKKTEQAIRKHRPDVRLMYVPNCIDFSTLPSNVTPDERTLLLLGWVLPEKGVGELVGAWNELDLPGWRLIIAGPGKVEYQQTMMRQYPQKPVEFTGQLSYEQAMQLLARCTLFVLPSHTEGFPFVILEAMALRRPIIATTVGAIPEMLEGGCGILIPPRNADALRAALAGAIADPAACRAMALKAERQAQCRYALPAVYAMIRDQWFASVRDSRDSGVHA